MAFHDAAEIDITKTDKMGPDGCLSATSDNNGLLESTSLILSVLEPIWQSNCDKISRADFWALFAKLSIEKADPTGTIRIPFQYGRVDTQSCSAGAGRLPSAQNFDDAYSQVFQTQMGFTPTQTVTLMGAHTIGHVHLQNSGYGVQPDSNTNNLVNSWDPTPNVFDNEYYRGLLGVNWGNKPVPGDTPRTKNIWAVGTNSIMLNTDMALAFSIDKTTTDLCVYCGVLDQHCGGGPNTQFCTSPGSTAVTGAKASTYATVQSFQQSNAAFLAAFQTTFAQLVSLGYGGVPATGATVTGKIGSLTGIDLTACP